jgi:hypothetical protein
MEQELLERRYGEFVIRVEDEEQNPLARSYGDLVILTRRGRLHALRWGCVLIPGGSATCWIATNLPDIGYLREVVGWPGAIAILLGFGSLFNAAVGRYYNDGDL